MDKILVIEDNLTLGKALVYGLGQNNYKAYLAPRLSEAWIVLSREIYDLIIIDVELPDGSGFDFLNDLRKQEKYKNIPTIFLTARNDPQDILTGLRKGADDYICKPFLFDEVLLRIKNIMVRFKMSSRVLICNDIKIDLDKMYVEIRGEEVSFSSIEYKIILYFMNNPLKNISRDEIKKAISNISSEVIPDNTLNVYIKRVREKLSEKGLDYIKTLRNVGYRWTEEVQKG